MLTLDLHTGALSADETDESSFLSNSAIFSEDLEPGFVEWRFPVHRIKTLTVSKL